MIKGGFSGKILHVDLSKGNIRTEPLDASMAEQFVGGLGLTIKLAYDAITPGTDALSPLNPIVLGAGPLVGTNLPSTSRMFAVTKLPTSGTIGWCGAGGANFGCQLKNAGYDNIVITGKSDHPVYLDIDDDNVRIKDAGKMWGLSVEETCESIWQKKGPACGALTIGPAGENLVPFSMAFVDRVSTLGRGGFGAVMGAKNLKGIAVKGSHGITIADRKRYKHLLNDFLKTIREYPYLKEWQDLGLIKSFPLIDKGLYEKIKKRRLACVSCPIGCKDLIEIPDGEFKGFVKHTSSIINLLTPVLYGFKDYRESIKCMATIDKYGLDMFEFFGIMTFTKTLSDHGIISQDLLDPDIVLDSVESMEAWAKKISFRQGFGNVLADGFKGIIKEFGKQAEELAPPLIKGMHPYAGPGSALAWHLFGTMELGQVLEPRGPHVGSGGSPTYFAKRPLEVFPRHLARMGVPEEAIAEILPGMNSTDGKQALKVGKLLRYSHRWFSILGSMGICARAAINRFYNASLCTEFYESVTGIKTDLDDLRMRVDRSWTLLRLANMREGLKKEDEILPAQWLKEQGFKDYLTEKPLTSQDSEEMIGDYFEEWGWDRDTGIPTQERIKELGLG